MSEQQINARLVQSLVENQWLDAQTAQMLQPQTARSCQEFVGLLRQWGIVPDEALAPLYQQAIQSTHSAPATASSLQQPAPLQVAEATVAMDPPTAAGLARASSSQFAQAPSPMAAASSAATPAIATSSQTGGELIVRDERGQPTHIDGYEIVSILGEGGMGVVYKARDPDLDDYVAIKMLIAGEHASLGSLERFVAEGQTLQKLREHPNIVKVLRAKRDTRSAFMVMEYVEGTDLKNLIAAGMVKERPAARVVADIAGALALAHEKGVIHRDIKPANILIDKSSRARLTDFGVAKVNDGDDGNTMTGAVLGTIPYMAPEQAEDSSTVDERTDVYGLGAVLYECLTGRPPHIGSSPTNILSSLLSKDPPRPSELVPDVDEVLEAICLKAIAKDPAKRYQSCLELQAALEDYRHGDESVLDLLARDARVAAPPPSRAPLNIGLGLSLAANLALIALLLLRPGAAPSPSQAQAPVEAPGVVTPPPKAALALAEDAPQVAWARGEGPASLELPLAGASWPEGARLALAFADGQRLSAPIQGGVARFPQVGFGDEAEVTILGAADGELSEATRLGSLMLRRDAAAPVIRLESAAPAAGPLVSRTRRFLLRGEVEEEELAELRFEPAPAKDLSEDGVIHAEFELPATGELALRVIARDVAGWESEATLPVCWRELRLELTVTGEAARVTRAETLELKGRFAPISGTLSARLGEAALSPRKVGGEWRLEVPATEEEAEVVIAIEAEGEVVERRVTVRRDASAPAVTAISGAGLSLEALEGHIEAARVALGAEFSEAVGWRLERREGEGWRELARGEGAAASVEVPLPQPGRSELRWRLEDEVGLLTELGFAILREAAALAPLAEELALSVGLRDAAVELTVTAPLSVTALRLGEVEATAAGEDAEQRTFSALIPGDAIEDGALEVTATRYDQEETLSLRFRGELLKDLDAWSAAFASRPGQLDATFTVAVIAARLRRDFDRVELQRQTCGPRSFQIASFWHKGLKMVFQLIPGSKEVGPFLCARAEMTWIDWRECGQMSRMVYRFRRLPKNAPAFGMTWEAAKRGLAKLELSGGLAMDLPTAAEWVYACRGGSEDEFFWGPEPEPAGAFVHRDAPANVRVHNRSDSGNAFGLIDMIGNVREWVDGDAPPGRLPGPPKGEAKPPKPPLPPRPGERPPRKPPRKGPPDPASVAWGYAYGGRAFDPWDRVRLRPDAHAIIPKAAPGGLTVDAESLDLAALRGLFDSAAPALQEFCLTGLRPIVRLPASWFKGR